MNSKNLCWNRRHMMQHVTDWFVGVLCQCSTDFSLVHKWVSLYKFFLFLFSLHVFFPCCLIVSLINSSTSNNFFFYYFPTQECIVLFLQLPLWAKQYWISAWSNHMQHCIVQALLWWEQCIVPNNLAGIVFWSSFVYNGGDDDCHLVCRRRMSSLWISQPARYTNETACCYTWRDLTECSSSIVALARR